MSVKRRVAADAVVLAGHGSRDFEAVEACRGVGNALSARLALPVATGFLEFADPPLAEAVAGCVSAGASRIVILPFVLGPATHQKNDIPSMVHWARERWPNVEIRYGASLGAQHSLVTALADRIADALASTPSVEPLEQTAVVVVGRGSRDPDSNSEVAKMARLVFEGRNYGWVETAFHSLTRPGVEDMVDRVIRLGARRVVVAPYLLFGGRIADGIAAGATSVCQSHSVPLVVSQPLSGHPGVLDAVVREYHRAAEGLSAANCDLCKYRLRFAGFENELNLPQGSDHRHGFRGIDSVLPPRYRGEIPVSAAPMSAANLQYDQDGRVAWDRIWGSIDPDSPFCELALAGGPPHRGSLLEPVDPTAVIRDPGAYAGVIEELSRGIGLTTGLRAHPGKAPGWLAVECDSAEMAIWLLRAIVVENISARREDSTLYLPVGPDFRLEHEIKNVITALAKTHHYWKEHQRAG